MQHHKLENASLKTIWKILTFVLVPGLFAVINALMHEFGPCFTINAIGGKAAWDISGKAQKDARRILSCHTL